MKRLLYLLVGVLVFVFSITSLSQAKITFVTIGTGGVTGVYYPAGGAISKMVNAKFKKYHIKMTVESTAGSVYNINAVLSGDLDFGICQSDREYEAWNGLAEWKDKGPQKNLRSVFGLHNESITLVARADAGINSVYDLKGKRVNLGNPGSGQLQNAKDVLKAFGISLSDIHPEYVKAVEAPGLLQDGRIDAFFYTVGHPNGAIKEATSGRIKVKIIPIAGKPVEKLLKTHPYYAKSEIPVKKFYPMAANKKDVVWTIGVKALVVTSKNEPDNVVYAITKEVFDHLDQFKKLHPAFATLTKKNMLEGMTAPIHPGALKYYRESGLIKYIPKKLIQQ